MTQDQIQLLKSQLPISLNITLSMDYPNGIPAETVYQKPDGSKGIFYNTPEPYPLARITGVIGNRPQYAVIITWKYRDDPDEVMVDYSSAIDGDEKIIPILQLKEFLLKLKS